MVGRAAVGRRQALCPSAVASSAAGTKQPRLRLPAGAFRVAPPPPRCFAREAPPHVDGSAMSEAGRLDIVVYGATGFTGSQAAEYLGRRAPSGLRWGIAGRNRQRLEEIARNTQPADVIIADSSDAASIDAMVRRARVV